MIEWRRLGAPGQWNRREGRGRQPGSHRQAWAVMLAAFLASIAVAANQFKVPPVMQVLMADLGADMAMGGWFTSVIAVAGIVLALPSAFILMRFGLKATGLAALACTVAGSLLGAIARDSNTMLLARMVEGGGTGLIAIVAPAAISAWFAPEERGLPMGLWASWLPVGNVIMFNLAHPLLNAFGWQGIWYFGALLALVALAIYGLVVTDPPAPARQAPLDRQAIGRALLSPVAWLLALAFGSFSFGLLGYNAWAPTYLTSQLQLDRATASSYASLMFLAAIPANIGAGWVLGRVRQRAILLPLAFLITSPLFAWGFQLGSAAAAVPYMMALGLTSNAIPTVLFTLAPETMPTPRFAGVAQAIIRVGAEAGRLIGPPIVGTILSGGGWTAASLCLAAVMGLGSAAALLAWQWLRPAPDRSTETRQVSRSPTRPGP